MSQRLIIKKRQVIEFYVKSVGGAHSRRYAGLTIKNYPLKPIEVKK
jgi:hypothetical protein